MNYDKIPNNDDVINDKTYKNSDKSNGYIYPIINYPSIHSVVYTTIFSGIFISNLYNYKKSPIYDPKNTNYKTYIKLGTISLFKGFIYPFVFPYVIYDIIIRDYGGLGGIQRHFIPFSVYFRKLIKK